MPFFGDGVENQSKAIVYQLKGNILSCVGKLVGLFVEVGLVLFLEKVGLANFVFK